MIPLKLNLNVTQILSQTYICRNVEEIFKAYSLLNNAEKGMNSG